MNQGVGLHQPADHSGTLISDFQLPERWEMSVCCSSDTQPKVFCYSSLNGLRHICFETEQEGRDEFLPCTIPRAEQHWSVHIHLGAAALAECSFSQAIALLANLCAVGSLVSILNWLSVVSLIPSLLCPFLPGHTLGVQRILASVVVGSQPAICSWSLALPFIGHLCKCTVNVCWMDECIFFSTYWSVSISFSLCCPAPGSYIQDGWYPSTLRRLSLLLRYLFIHLRITCFQRMHRMPRHPSPTPTWIFILWKRISYSHLTKLSYENLRSSDFFQLCFSPFSLCLHAFNSSSILQRRVCLSFCTSRTPPPTAGVTSWLSFLQMYFAPLSFAVSWRFHLCLLPCLGSPRWSRSCSHYLLPGFSSGFPSLLQCSPF
jgi:hypothetical protein